jgi:hypothetical protein
LFNFFCYFVGFLGFFNGSHFHFRGLRPLTRNKRDHVNIFHFLLPVK